MAQQWLYAWCIESWSSQNAKALGRWILRTKTGESANQSVNRSSLFKWLQQLRRPIQSLDEQWFDRSCWFEFNTWCGVDPRAVGTFDQWHCVVGKPNRDACWWLHTNSVGATGICACTARRHWWQWSADFCRCREFEHCWKLRKQRHDCRA